MFPHPTLQLPDKWLWDFWPIQDGSDYHLFYLQASKALRDPHLRHWNVSIGHAVSKDLLHWETLPDVLKPGYANRTFGGRHEYTTWTGSVIHHEGLWYLFYTCSYKEEKGLIQRISLATSSDLIHWEKHPRNPLFGADHRYYEALDLNLWHDEAWRDPWVFKHPETGEFHALITARANHGPGKTRGVIGHATSKNLIDWQVLPPLTKPSNFATMECAQLVKLQGRYYLLFSVPPREFTGSNLTGTFYMVADDPLGPFSEPKVLWADPVGQLYAGKLLKGPEERWYFMAWRNLAQDGTFHGDVCEALPVTVDEQSNLLVYPPAMLYN